MPDLNEVMRQLAANSGDAQTLQKLRAAMNTPNGRQAVKSISASNAADLERAAQAAQRGDMAEAARLAQKLMQTNEGASLVNQLKTMLFPK